MVPAFLAFDTETTGLDPDTNEILSIALVLLDASFNTLDERIIYAFPEGEVHPKAAEVNGYTAESWAEKGAVSQLVLFAQTHEFIRPHRRLIPLGHNVKFDIGFLRSLFRRHDSSDLGRHLSHHSIDTVGIALFFDMVLFGKKSGAYSLGALCERFGIPLENAHDALADIHATIALFQYLYTQLGGQEKRAAVPAPVVFSRLLGKKDGKWHINGGRHKGELLTSVAERTPDYLQWMLAKVDDLSETQRAVVQKALSHELVE